MRFAFCFLILVGCATKAPLDVPIAVATDPVAQDADDPAIWVNAADPAKSLIFGTNKVKAPNGAIVVFGLDGRIRQTVDGVDRPNNIDVEYKLDGIGDIAVATERMQDRLRVFAVTAEGIRGIGTVASCKEPMGIGLYRRPSDGAIFAIVAPKGRENSPREGYLQQFRLTAKEGQVTGELVRTFGRFSGSKEIEAVVVDDELGFVYYADEGEGIRKYHADPDHSDAGKELAIIGKTGYRGDREGLTIYRTGPGTGYLISTDQLPKNSRYRVYRREGRNEEVFTFAGGADTTDGIDATSSPLGAAFPQGLFIAMNSSGRNFLIYRWQDVAKAGVRP